MHACMRPGCCLPPPEQRRLSSSMAATTGASGPVCRQVVWTGTACAAEPMATELQQLATCRSCPARRAPLLFANGAAKVQRAPSSVRLLAWLFFSVFALPYPVAVATRTHCLPHRSKFSTVFDDGPAAKKLTACQRQPTARMSLSPLTTDAIDPCLLIHLLR